MMSKSFYTVGGERRQHAGMSHSHTAPALANQPTDQPAALSAHETTPLPRPAGQRPPGPRSPWLGLPLLGAMRRDYLGFLGGLKHSHGDIVHSRILHYQSIDLFTPDLAREALVDNADHLVRWERGVEVFAQSFGQSVLTTEGATWQRQRRMLMPAFTPKRVAGYAELMREAARSVLEGAVPAGQREARVVMDGLFGRVAMEAILRTLFSRSAQADAQAATEATQVLSEVALREMFWPVTLPDWLPLPGKAAKRHALHTLRSLVGRHIDERRARPPAAAEAGAGTDLLAMLLALRDEDTGAGLSEAEVFDQCMVSFQAGHETTSTALLWWSRLMAEHPAAAQRAADEIDQVLAGREPTPDDLATLPWLGATLKEAMRLYPPVAALMSRRTTRDIRLGGWHVPRGTILRITPWLLQRDARWFAEPEAFGPERFMPDAPPVPRGAWLPFGAGPRVCIGQHFATLEMTLVAAMLLQRYRLVLPPGAEAAVAVMNVTLRPRDPIELLLQRRT